MKLSDYAKAKGVRYETAWRWFRDGQIKGRRIGRTIIVEEEDVQEHSIPQKVAIYARVSSTENKSSLESQAERLAAYSTAKGYQIAKVWSLVSRPWRMCSMVVYAWIYKRLCEKESK